jgi:hypothetical protein
MSRNVFHALVALLALGISGCAAPLKVFDVNQTTINPDMYVVALSFDSSALAADSSYGIHSRLSYAGLHWSQAPNVVVGSDISGVYALMLESAKPTFDLGELELTWKKGVGNYYAAYESATSGPIIDLDPGVITYVGSVVIKRVKFDTKTGKPLSVTLSIEDAWDNNVERWKNYYPIMLDHDPIRRIAPVWGDAGQVALKRAGRVSSSPDYSKNLQAPPPR